MVEDIDEEGESCLAAADGGAAGVGAGRNCDSHFQCFTMMSFDSMGNRIVGKCVFSHYRKLQLHTKYIPLF